MIIIEGPDNSGKSTLGQLVAESLNLTVKDREGPPRGPGEILQRIIRYEAQYSPDTHLFVGHPMISHPIYSRLREHDQSNTIPPHAIPCFYRRPMLLIYCDGRGLKGHVVKDHDSPEHLEQVTKRYNDILQAYRRWAMKHANIFYRIGDDMQTVIHMCKAYHERRMEKGQGVNHRV